MFFNENEQNTSLKTNCLYNKKLNLVSSNQNAI